MYFSIGKGTTCRRQPKFDSVIQVGTPQPVNEQINNVCPTSVLFRILPIHLENAIQSNDG